MRSELGESPAVVDRLLADQKAPVAALAAAMRERGVESIVVAARGTSDHAAIYGQYIFGVRNEILVVPAAPSVVSLYGANPRLGNALVLGISQSGRSPDVVAMLEAGRRQGALTAAFTNDPDSELARAAGHVIALEAGPERAVAATKTYVAELALLALLSAALSGGEAESEIAAVPDAMRAALRTEDRMRGLAESWAGQDVCAVLARGFEYATAREWALKLKELAYVLADPYSAADFQHGPIALVHEGFPVLALAIEGVAFPGMIELLQRVRGAGARLIVLTDTPDAAKLADALGDVVEVPAVAEWLSPLVTILPAQLFAYHLARARGLDTESPRNITKVTLTL